MLKPSQSTNRILSLRPSSRLSSSLPPPPPLSSLWGTVQPHTAFILLHTTHPPPTFPARGPVSQVSKRLQLSVVKWGGVVNWVWRGRLTPASDGSGVEPPPAEEIDAQKPDESYRATVFSKNGQLEIPHVSLGNVDEIGDVVRRFAIEPGEAAGEKVADEIHLLVCTHMARDCRCGEQGGAFVRRLREEIEHTPKERLKGIAEIRVGEVGHIGGHLYAPNLLIYPYGDWYGFLSPSQAPQVLDDIIHAAVDTRGVRPLERTEAPLLVSHGLRGHWRGRMGMSKEDQASLADKLGLGRS
ncbi:hypothetical protein AX15_004790 [Amanita polypyramis BW_CC]|nr:hypothetical protein AX15_004790 [Amanita polypyramis BW_CC]